MKNIDDIIYELQDIREACGDNRDRYGDYTQDRLKLVIEALKYYLDSV